MDLDPLPTQDDLMDPSPSASPSPLEDDDDDLEYDDVIEKVKEPYEPGDDVDFVIHIKFGPEKLSEKWGFYEGATFQDLLARTHLKWAAYDWSMSKAIVEKRVAGVKSLLKGNDDDDLRLDIGVLKDNSLRFMAPKSSEQQGMREARAAIRSLDATRRAAIGRVPRIHRNSHNALVHNMYTFHTIRPLPYLPNPERSKQFLERLKEDPGIKAAMLKHKFSVGLLTEMDPSQHTTSNHEGTTRTLGLNRNKGEVIELRLRTDAYDGYRDYKTIRKTLCHELAHNVHSAHDRKFWDLCHQIEREVHTADWKSGGRVVGGDVYRPVVDDSHEDVGGWVGGEYTLGGDSSGTAGLTRREILRRAAESRWRINEKKRRDSGPGAGPAGGSNTGSGSMS